MTTKPYSRTIGAEDGYHNKTFATWPQLRADVENQIGGTIENRLDFMYNDGTENYKPINVDQCIENGHTIQLVDDWGRTITFCKDSV